jgi:hypothetical protein
MIATATGRRTDSGRYDQGNASIRAGLHVDRIVPNAEPGDDAKTPAFRTLLRPNLWAKSIRASMSSS